MPRVAAPSYPERSVGMGVSEWSGPTTVKSIEKDKTFARTLNKNRRISILHNALVRTSVLAVTEVVTETVTIGPQCQGSLLLQRVVPADPSRIRIGSHWRACSRTHGPKRLVEPQKSLEEPRGQRTVLCRVFPRKTSRRLILLLTKEWGFVLRRDS